MAQPAAIHAQGIIIAIMAITAIMAMIAIKAMTAVMAIITEIAIIAVKEGLHSPQCTHTSHSPHKARLCVQYTI